MRKDPKYFLSHIVESIALIEGYTNNISMEEFKESQETQDAVLRRLEIIGEATKNIPQSVKAKDKEIPWKLMAGLRDVVIHEYFGLEMDTIWKTLKEDLPKVKKSIERLSETL